jgi:hypothetical protein
MHGSIMKRNSLRSAHGREGPVSDTLTAVFALQGSVTVAMDKLPVADRICSKCFRRRGGNPCSFESYSTADNVFDGEKAKERS